VTAPPRPSARTGYPRQVQRIEPICDPYKYRFSRPGPMRFKPALRRLDQSPTFVFIAAS
jgi:hypothetical protein